MLVFSNKERRIFYSSWFNILDSELKVNSLLRIAESMITNNTLLKYINSFFNQVQW